MYLNRCTSNPNIPFQTHFKVLNSLMVISLLTVIGLVRYLWCVSLVCSGGDCPDWWRGEDITCCDLSLDNKKDLVALNYAINLLKTKTC